VKPWGTVISTMPVTLAVVGAVYVNVNVLPVDPAIAVGGATVSAPGPTAAALDCTTHNAAAMPLTRTRHDSLVDLLPGKTPSLLVRPILDQSRSRGRPCQCLRLEP
jgi:hypothetical protein